MNGKASAESGTIGLPPGRLVYRYQEAGQLLGGLGRKTVAKLVREGKLTATTIGAYPMVTLASIEAYIEQGKGAARAAA